MAVSKVEEHLEACVGARPVFVHLESGAVFFHSEEGKAAAQIKPIRVGGALVSPVRMMYPRATGICAIATLTS